MAFQESKNWPHTIRNCSFMAWIFVGAGWNWEERGRKGDSICFKKAVSLSRIMMKLWSMGLLFCSLTLSFFNLSSLCQHLRTNTHTDTANHTGWFTSFSILYLICGVLQGLFLECRGPQRPVSVPSIEHRVIQDMDMTNPCKKSPPLAINGEVSI